jgi:hypothetical protein
MRCAVVTLVLTLAALPAAAQLPRGDLPLPPAPEGTTQPAAPENRVPPPPTIRDLGEERYAVGDIVIDRKTSSFTAPGRILDIASDLPLEFIVAARDATKSYESLIELNSDAYQFNIACILIGLTRHPDRQPRRHFDPQPVEGDGVDVLVEWTKDDTTHRVNAAELIRVGGQKTARDEWVYTGSAVLPNGHYLAHISGTMVGFVHDQASIIQHRTGLGLGNYGAVTLDPAVSPPKDTPVIVTIRKRAGS